MSLIIIHLRWNNVSSEEYEQVCWALPGGDVLPAGCLSRQLRRVGHALLGTEVWRGGDAAGSVRAQLPAIVQAVGLDEPQTVIFSVPKMFAVAYQRSADDGVVAHAGQPVNPMGQARTASRALAGALFG
jgi:hypothetical protein